MAVFRVERNKGYTVMSNHHLRNKELSLKAKGLLSQMLSLPEDWDYTLAGLSFINREKIDAIREAVKELERAGLQAHKRFAGLAVALCFQYSQGSEGKCSFRRLLSCGFHFCLSALLLWLARKLQSHTKVLVFLP